MLTSVSRARDSTKNRGIRYIRRVWPGRKRKQALSEQLAEERLAAQKQTLVAQQEVAAQQREIVTQQQELAGQQQAALAAQDELAKLGLVSEELDRELQDTSDRQSNAITRLSIVFAGAGVSIFATIDPDGLALSLIPSGLSFIAAILSLAGLRYWDSKAVQSNETYIANLINATARDAHWRLIDDKHSELIAVSTDLERKTKYVAWSTGFLLAGWMSVAAITFVVTPILNGIGY